jgi:hypothetical protein
MPQSTVGKPGHSHVDKTLIFITKIHVHSLFFRTETQSFLNSKMDVNSEIKEICVPFLFL